MIWTIIGVLVLLWLIGLLANIGGGIIHLLLVIALIVFIWDLFVGRRRV
jgi:K+-transporting ATPase A subunit